MIVVSNLLNQTEANILWLQYMQPNNTFICYVTEDDRLPPVVDA